MVGVGAEQQARHTAAFKRMMEIAHRHGIDVTVAFWDHIYRGEVQGGGIPGASEAAGKRVKHLVTGVTTENLVAYNKAALAKFLEVFPEIDAIQFRMHWESGPDARGDAGILARHVRDHPQGAAGPAGRPAGEGPARPGDRRRGRPGAELPHRHQVLDGADGPAVSSEPRQPPEPARPAARLRRPAALPEALPGALADVERRHHPLPAVGRPGLRAHFVDSVGVYGGDSFEVNEMLATWMLGEDHDAEPLELLSPVYRFYDHEFERYWYYYQVWGRVSYDPDAAGGGAAARVRAALRRGSAGRT